MKMTNDRSCRETPVLSPEIKMASFLEILGRQDSTVDEVLFINDVKDTRWHKRVTQELNESEKLLMLY